MRISMLAVCVVTAAVTAAAAAPAAGRQTRNAVAQAKPRSLRLTLGRLADPATRVDIEGREIRFGLHAMIRFATLDELFAHIDAEAGRWTFASPAERARFADGLMRRGVESRIVSMETELPLEVLLTHTRGELERATAAVRTSDAPLVFKGRHWELTADAYRDAFLRVRDRWSTSLNCWSAASTIPARVLSNWYVIDEGIDLYGATYDSTEHFWQAVKYHPEVTAGDLRKLLAALMTVDWRGWVERLRSDQAFYFGNAYAIEFLDRNLTRERLAWFDAELARVARPDEPARSAQQRIGRAAGEAVRFTSLDEKVLWGDLADVLHLIVAFSSPGRASETPAITAVRDALLARRFDAVYLTGYAGGRVAFLSPEFQALMLEIWKVKFLEIPRLAEVIRSTTGRRLDHFLDDGDSPDIPIPVYVGYLNRIRDMALEETRR